MNGNLLTLVGADGTRHQVDQIEGLTVEFRGTGSEIEIGEGSVFRNTKVIIGTQSRVTIETTNPRGLINTSVDMGGSGSGKLLVIGRGTSIESCRFAMANEGGIEVRLGQNCLLSSNITFRPADGHVIVDRATGKIVNRTRPIVIGDNVWIGSGATFVKGSVVANHSIVATQALVSRRFEEQYTVIAGNPAQVVKRDVAWDRAYIEGYVEPAKQDSVSP